MEYIGLADSYVLTYHSQGSFITTVLLVGAFHSQCLVVMRSVTTPQRSSIVREFLSAARTHFTPILRSILFIVAHGKTPDQRRTLESDPVP
jgi:ABC-type xylose transport system permease subunit